MRTTSAKHGCGSHRSPTQYFNQKLKGDKLVGYYPKGYVEDVKFINKLRQLGLYADEREASSFTLYCIHTQF